MSTLDHVDYDAIHDAGRTFEAFLGTVMDRHLTNGTRSIPVVILLDEGGEPRGWWGPRPAPLQAWFEEAGRRLPREDRYRELRRWYARDRGRTIAAPLPPTSPR